MSDNKKMMLSKIINAVIVAIGTIANIIFSNGGIN